MFICAFFVDGYVIHIKNVPFRMNGMFLQGLFKGGATFKVRHYFQDVKELYFCFLLVCGDYCVRTIVKFQLNSCIAARCCQKNNVFLFLRIMSMLIFCPMIFIF